MTALIRAVCHLLYLLKLFHMEILCISIHPHVIYTLIFAVFDVLYSRPTPSFEV